MATTCCSECCAGKKNLLEQFPEKTRALEAYIGSLELSDDMERRRGVLIGCLHKAQGLFGYLPLEVQEHIARRLRLQQSDVYGVISFYSFFTDKPIGKYKINVCTGTACFVRGADKIMAEFSQRLGIGEGQTSADMKFTLMSIRCIGACSLAPVVMVNERIYASMTPQKVAQVIEDCE